MGSTPSFHAVCGTWLLFFFSVNEKVHSVVRLVAWPVCCFFCVCVCVQAHWHHSTVQTSVLLINLVQLIKLPRKSLVFHCKSVSLCYYVKLIKTRVVV